MQKGIRVMMKLAGNNKAQAESFFNFERMHNSMDSISIYRDSNFELLRLLSIYLIILFHCSWHGGIQPGGVSGNILIDIVNQFGELGVNCFVLISGYYAHNSHFKLKKLCSIILQTNYYVFLCALIIAIFFNQSFINLLLVNSFPVIFSRYWFVTAYVLLYIISPYIQILIENLNYKTYRTLLMTILFIWCIVPSIFGVKYGVESMLFYNRFEWFIFCYLLGAFLYKYGDKIFKTLRTTFLLLALFSTISIVFIIFINNYNITVVDGNYFWPPNSILQVFISASFFYLFRFISIPYNKIINYLASCTLGIYLLHDGMLSRYIWHAIFKFDEDIASIKILPKMIFASVAIFIAGIIMDSLWKHIEKLFIYIVRKVRNKFSNCRVD